LQNENDDSEKSAQESDRQIYLSRWPHSHLVLYEFGNQTEVLTAELTRFMNE
jgi:hypothetical protein